MASSLTFRLRSLFESQGVKEAQSGFQSVLGVVGRLAAVAAGLALRFRTLGVVLGATTVVQVGRLAFSLIRSTDAAARAQKSFVRLQTQLELLGQGTTENIQKVKEFSQVAESSTRFAASEVQESVAIALRRTGDLEQALRQVATAQDIAAATGRNLRSVTLLLNIAQAGNTRLIRQITNLRRADIQAAARQGKLIELLAERFGGAAQRAAGTFAAQLQILANAQERFRKEIGQIFLPLNQFALSLRIGLTQGINEAVASFRELSGVISNLPEFLGRNVAFADRFAEALARTGNAGASFVIALRQARDEVRAFQRGVTEQAGGFKFDFDKQLEIANLRLGKSRDVRQQISRDIARANELIRIVESGFLNELRGDQVEFVRQFQFGRRAIDQALAQQTDILEASKRAQFESRRQRIVQAGQRGRDEELGVPGRLSAALVRLAEGSNVVRSALESVRNVAPGITETVVNAFRSIGEAADVGTQGIVSFSSKFSREGSSIVQTAQNIADNISQIIETRIRPNFQVNVSFSTPIETIQSAVRSAVAGALPQIQQQLSADTAQIIRESQANASA